MGHKKRNVAPSRSSKASGAPPPSPVISNGGGGSVSDGVVSSVETEQNNTNSNSSIEIQQQQQQQQQQSKIEASVVESDASPYTGVKLECERALTALRRGNHTKALRLMKEMCLKHENSAHSALIHRVQGTVCVKVASIIDDPNAKQRHLKNAIESARKAAVSSPNSIEFAHFYANLLYEAANDGKEYEEVVQECERALAIENPVDPAKESLQDESQQKILTADARITHVQNELRSLIQKSNIASISTWMKNLGNGEEKFRLIPIRRVSEDPMEVRLVQARRPNEIKKATKTPEERRKEIEVRVAAARLLQQKSEAPQSQNDENKALDSSSGSGQRAAERRKSGNLRKNASSAERRDWVRSYWNSMNLDMKKDLIRIRISELKAHFSSSKDNLANEVLSEAISFTEGNRTWKFWMCCRCSEKFADSESHMQHVLQEHMGNLLPKMQSILPQNVDNEWIEMLLNCSWKPLDVNASIKMLENQLKPQAPELLGESYQRNYAEECKDCLTNNDCSEDAWDLSPQREKFGDSCNGDIVECKSYDKVSDIRWRECDGNHAGKAYFLPDSWPLSDDPERAKLLEKIHATFQVLIRHKYLAASHVHKVIQYSMDELQGIASGSQLLNYGVEQTPICICFLGASELKKVLKYLQELSHSCGIGRYSEKSSAIDDSNTGTQGAEIMEKIVLNEDASCLLLDEHFLPCNLPSTICHEVVTDDAAAPTSTNAGCENSVILDADALLSWIFTGPTAGEQLALWTRMREEKSHQGMEILQTLEKDFYHLQSMYERKCEHLSYEEALQSVEDLCLEEGKKREHVTEFVRRSYESVLRKRREELIESDNDIMFISNRFELDAISHVLKEAESLNANQLGFEETYSGVTNQLCDLESGEDDDWRMKDYLHQVDSCIEVAIQRQKEQLATELSKLDAKMMRNLTGMQQMEAKLDPVSALDYRLILVPLVKSFMRARLEDLAEKDATEKSDAAREAFLAELALDSKKGTGGGGDNSRNVQEKTRDKKKNKENRKTKDLKATGTDELVLHHETTEQGSFPVASDVDYPDSEIVWSVSGDALKQQEEEIRRRIELEAAERKLEETLEYQRRIEEEAKKKHLAEQNKKTTTTIPDKHSDDDQDRHGQLKHCKKEPLTQQNGFPNVLEGALVNAADRSAQRIGNTHGHLHTYVKQGLPNGGIVEDGALSSDRRTGRKGRRQRSSSKLVDAKYQAVSSEKENIEAGQVRVKNGPHGDSNNPCVGDNGTKTLRQLRAEEDDEERFQADIKKAVCQSLDLRDPVAMLERRRQELLRKMDQIIQLDEKFKHGIYLNKEELNMIKQKDETSWLIDEYDEIFNDLKKFISQRQPQLVQSKKSELTALIEIIYLGSLFDLSSSKEKADLNKLKNIERNKFVGLENVDFDKIGKISKEMIRQLSDPWNTHSSHLQACKESVADVLDPSSDSYTELKSVLDRVVSSDHFNVPINETFQKCSSKKNWHGGTLNHWMEEYRVEMVVKSTVQAGNQRLEEARLTDIGRYIIRGMMKNVMHFHRKGIAHCNLKSDTIILNEKYDVTLTGNQYSHNQKDMRKDGADLKTILEILIGNEIPKDVAHLLDLLGNYQSYNQDIMFHHSCLWTPFEMIKNIFLFRTEIGCSPKVVVDPVWNALRNLPEENVDWASLVCMHPLYKRAFDRWQLEGVHSGGVLLSFMRMCFIHVHQHVKLSMASQKQKEKEEVRPLRQTENDLFVLFPLYMPHFLEHTKFSALVKGIYRSDF